MKSFHLSFSPVDVKKLSKKEQMELSLDSEKASDDDRQWFADHSLRRFRCRECYSSEKFLAGTPVPTHFSLRTIVHQIKPGERRRYPVALDIDDIPPDWFEADETLERILKTGLAGGGRVQDEP